jgi:nucleotide-binding universal stress UspA family protein
MAATIVAAVDRSSSALHAARLLAGYRGARDALSIVLLNVQPGPGLEHEGRAELEEARALLAGAGLAVETAVRFGGASEQIIEAAGGRDGTTIVIGTRGHGALRGFALGSVALRVAHGAGSPVVLVQADTRLPEALGRGVRSLVALDGSAGATRALTELLAREAWLGRLEVELVHVRRAPGALEDLQAEEATRDARALVYAAGRRCRVHEPQGDAVLEVVRLAEALRVDLVVMGTRGLGALHHALVGSVALKVAIGSPVPVMLVP